MPNPVQPEDTDTGCRERANSRPQQTGGNLLWCELCVVKCRSLKIILSSLTHGSYWKCPSLQNQNADRCPLCKHTTFLNVPYGTSHHFHRWDICGWFTWGVCRAIINSGPKDFRPIIKMFHLSVWCDGCHSLALGNNEKKTKQNAEQQKCCLKLQTLVHRIELKLCCTSQSLVSLASAEAEPRQQSRQRPAEVTEQDWPGCWRTETHATVFTSNICPCEGEAVWDENRLYSTSVCVHLWHRVSTAKLCGV